MGKASGNKACSTGRCHTPNGFLKFLNSCAGWLGLIIAQLSTRLRGAEFGQLHSVRPGRLEDVLGRRGMILVP
jgi:hypothetical protein